jgi:hypothetical protein
MPRTLAQQFIAGVGGQRGGESRQGRKKEEGTPHRGPFLSPPPGLAAMGAADPSSELLGYSPSSLAGREGKGGDSERCSITTLARRTLQGVEGVGRLPAPRKMDFRKARGRGTDEGLSVWPPIATATGKTTPAKTTAST